MLCPYCGEPIQEASEDHIFPRFMGGTRTITTCAKCNNQFGHTFEGKAAAHFNRLHFHMASHGVKLCVPIPRWQKAFERDGEWYDAEIVDGETKFPLSKPCVDIDKERMVLNARFGSHKQMTSSLEGIRRKYRATIPEPEIQITPALMPAQAFQMGPELSMLAMKMCFALTTLLPGFSPLWINPKRGKATLALTLDQPKDTPPLAHVIYVERSLDGIHGVVALFGVFLLYCSAPTRTKVILPLVAPQVGLRAFLDPVTGVESFGEIPRFGLETPPDETNSATLNKGLERWGRQFREAAISRGAADTIHLSFSEHPQDTNSPETTQPERGQSPEPPAPPPERST